MRTDFDPLREAPLPDSFVRTADWLRAAPPPRPLEARPLLLALALTVAVGACAWPVEREAVLGWVVEARTTDAHGLLRALDAAVPAEGRLSAEVEPTGGGVSAVRYVVFDGDAASRARAVAEGAARGAAASVRVSTLDAPVRQPLGAVAARWLGVSANPRLSDAELQEALDRAFADHPSLAPRVGRADDGRRVVELDENVRLVLHPENRLGRVGDRAFMISGGDLSGFTVGGVPVLQLLGLDGVRRPGDSLAAGPSVRARTLSDAEAAALADSLGISPGALRPPSGPTRTFVIRVPDAPADGRAPPPAPRDP